MKNHQINRWRGLALAGTTLAMLFSVLFSALPSIAAPATPSPAPSPSYSNDALLIRGTITNEKLPVAGVKLHVTGNGFDGTATTDADGKWIIEVSKKGTYDVEIQLDSLPKGVGLRDPEKSVRQADLTIVNTAGILFPLGKDTRVVQSFGDQLVIRLWSGLNLGLLLAVAAIGISLIFGTTGLNNFAHGEMLTFGALMTWVFYANMNLPILLVAVLVLILGGAFGFSQDAFLWKPLRKKRVGLNQMMIVSIGFSIVVRYVLLIIFGGETKVVSGSFQSVQLGPIVTTMNSVVSMAVSLVTLAAVALFLTRTRIGKATRAVSDNSALAASTGIDVERIIRIVWIVAGTLTALAGLLYGLQFQANWLTGFQILLLLFASVTLGGLGTALGATVGAMIIGFVVELSVLVIPADLKYAASLIILVLVLLIRPQGVLGKKQRIG
ncbi:branched-chain amino acid ABC transporter permease [Rhodoluna sp.]|uniref:branched-chain amino acid ABC transporter permease n=1 Tax=Rhodoluna sp. TaxID=1969481 RepID=UPI0025F7A0C6|nr:branched-chain amino acid ABC transporter permease [Rhodoluna sp.]